jgi:protein ImuB
MWFPRLACEQVLRIRPVDAPFAVTRTQSNTNRLYSLNAQAEKQGLHQGMSYSDARAFCPDLMSRPVDLHAYQQFQQVLSRWATRYCPWVGLDGHDGLVLDISGVAHLFDGETAMLADIRQRLGRAGLTVRLGVGDTRGAAWALARHNEGVAEAGNMLIALQSLPVAALRIDGTTDSALQRLGLRTIGDLAATSRAPLTRRFGTDLLMRLDQALGHQPEQVSPQKTPPHYGVRMTLPEPIGLTDDVMSGTARLLDRLCDLLKEQDVGARILCLSLRRVDQESQHVELRLARPLRDAKRILPLFERGVAAVEAGYGIDQMRLEAVQIEHLPNRQISHVRTDNKDGLDDLISRLGTRIGIENIQRFLPADSHIPEHSFIVSPAAYSEPSGSWVALRPRPLRLFRAEPIGGQGRQPPRQFRWRRMALSVGRAIGPERIAPEWWLSDENWRSGVRDYWKVDTTQGRRLWLFYTPQNPGWFVQGEFA